MVAIVLALLLTRMAWNDNLESLSVSVNLAFYFPREQALAVSPFDVDGDGTSEALAVVHASSPMNWVLQILDLKPLHQFGKTHLAPFRPTVLFTSKDINEEGAEPLKLTTGQVLVKSTAQTQKKFDKKPYVVATDQELTDRTRHYFCGLDWHDTASKCATPCPSGQASECPGDEKCFADTPCDALSHSRKPMVEDTQVLFQLTPGGGLPSIVTFWSNGVLSLHSLTSDMSLEEEANTRKSSTKKQRRQAEKQLELRQMWRNRVFAEHIDTDAHKIEWDELNVRFLDSVMSEEQGSAHHGMILVSGSYWNYDDEEDWEDLEYTYFVLAVDAFTGKILWDSFSEEEKEGVQNLPLPMTRGATSMARRRSRIPSLSQVSPMIEPSTLPNCLVAFKHTLKDILPFAYWGPHDSDLLAIHMDQKKRNKDKNHDADHHAVKHHRGHEHNHDQHKLLPVAKPKKWHHRFTKKNKQTALVFGRPNVIATHSREGLNIRSLKNGRPLCHLSLLEETLYSDLNADGILDQVQVVTSPDSEDRKDKWVKRLLHKLEKEHTDLKEKGAKNKLMDSLPTPCHAMALSGMPPREEIFSTSLCGNTQERMGNNPSFTLESIAPIVVESLDGRRGSRDVIVALNNGMVHRLHGASGRKEWQLVGKHHTDFPTWEDSEDNESYAMLTRVQSDKVAPSIRPVLLVGENSMAVLSVKDGRVLASASFPQTSMTRPVLAEVSGDGTTDVMILSTDAIWGFQISVKPGASIALRIMVGLMLMGLMLAVLRNRFGQRKDKRSTDE
jgi:hypothetical protein